MADTTLRLQAAPHYRPPSLADIDPALQVVDGGRVQLVSAYWDTPDLRLARWGAVLVHGEGEGWTVWPPTGGQHADGSEGVSMDGEPTAPPKAALDLLRGYVRDATLAPVARVKRVRRTLALRTVEDLDLIRVLSDEVSVLDGRRVAVRYRQVLLRPSADADLALVHEVLTRLRAAGAGVLETADEHARILGPTASEGAEVDIPTLGPQSTLLDAIRAMVGTSVTRLLRHDAMVRIGRDPEGVHQARVATRRLRSDLETFKDVLEPGPLRRLRTELKWLADLLGAVRDTDVQIARLGRRSKEAAAPGGARAALMESLSARRDEDRRKLLGAMEGARYLRLLDTLVAFAEAPDLRVPGDQPAAAVLPALVSAPWKALARAVDKLPADPADEQLHAIRIAAKRVRYACEAAAPVSDKDAQLLAEAVAALQEVLGEFNDAVVARAWLWAAAPSLPPPAAFLAGVLSEMERSIGQQALEGWRSAWKAANKPRLRRWLPGG